MIPAQIPAHIEKNNAQVMHQIAAGKICKTFFVKWFIGEPLASLTSVGRALSFLLPSKTFPEPMRFPIGLDGLAGRQIRRGFCYMADAPRQFLEQF